MSNSSGKTPTYPGGITGLLTQMEGRLEPFGFAKGEALPELDSDLEALAHAIVPPAEQDPRRSDRPKSSNHRKLLDLRAELAGHSELAVLHGLLVAHLRKRSQPPHTAALFHRLWAEHADHLLQELNPRWQVSAITTFGDHGLTPTQRQVGAALSVLFNTMKLYESERRFSGTTSDKPFPLDRRRHSTLPLEMDPFSIASGGLDVNMLGRLWQDAQGDDVIRPLAHHLIDQLIHDPHTVFRRFRIMRTRLNRKRAMDVRDTGPSEPEEPPENIVAVPPGVVPERRSGQLRWGVVCTTNAPISDVAAWVAHYTELGAHALHVFLDAPDAETEALLAPLPHVHVTSCDARYWERVNKKRPAAHQLRQSFNATETLRTTDLHFLGHMDVDEFLISPVPVARALDFVPPDMAHARVRPVELLAPLSGPPRHFKRSHKRAGHRKQVLEAIFPNFGPYLAGGFISHTTGKVFARTGIPETRLGVHMLKSNGANITNMTELPRMALAHCHTSGFAHFRDRIAFRLERGSYRKAPEKETMALQDVLTFLIKEEGEEGLRSFYDEVCTARPELLQALDERGMLMTHDLELAAKVVRVFGDRAPPMRTAT
ncbi:glycosyltransferase family 2 protein [Primorskyibacter sp. S187A]|uniref:glycosyltransferase family 2 protein n=1 Tax=Primorskyibacter sp. S187A TaxID=3415130 RepID=UPI003C7A94A5